MNYKTCCEIFGISDISFLPTAAMRVVASKPEDRAVVYRRLLEANDFDMSRDWFQQVYESELSEGKRKGQHFTPTAVNELLSLLVEGDKPGNVHEPTAGTGSLVIADWYNHISGQWPWEVSPSHKFYLLWELSDRALPLLLINLSIRGMMATVYHGDVLEQKFKAKYLIINRTDDALGFSDIIADPEDKLIIKKV